MKKLFGAAAIAVTLAGSAYGQAETIAAATAGQAGTFVFAGATYSLATFIPIIVGGVIVGVAANSG